MEAKKIRKYLFRAYGFLAALLIGGLWGCKVICGRKEAADLLARSPMLIVDVLFMATMLGAILIRICMVEDYEVLSAFRVERKKYYAKRMRLLNLCVRISFILTLVMKAIMLLCTNQAEQLSMGRLLLYGVVFGVFYVGAIRGMMLLFELLPATVVTILMFTVPFVLLFSTVRGVPVPVISPKNLWAPAALAAVFCVLSILLGTIHKTRYETIDC